MECEIGVNGQRTARIYNASRLLLLAAEA